MCQAAQLTLILLTWRIWWAPTKASKWQMGLNLAFKDPETWISSFIRFASESLYRDITSHCDRFAWQQRSARRYSNLPWLRRWRVIVQCTEINIRFPLAVFKKNKSTRNGFLRLAGMRHIQQTRCSFQVAVLYVQLRLERKLTSDSCQIKWSRCIKSAEHFSSWDIRWSHCQQFYTTSQLWSWVLVQFRWQMYARVSASFYDV